MKKQEPLSESYFYILLCLAKGANHGYGIMQMTETLSDGDVQIETGQGVTVLNCAVIRLAATDGETVRALRINANVKVDGNAIQRFIGWLRDLILEIRSWQMFG